MGGSRLLAAQGVVYAVTMAGVGAAALTGGASAEQVAGPAMLWYDLVAVVFGVRAARHPGLDPAARRFARVFAVAVGLMLAITLTFMVTGTKGFPQLGDVFHIVLMLVLFAGLLIAPLRAGARRERGKTLLDSGIVVAGASMLLWYLVIGPSLETPKASVGLLLAAACYPVADLLVLFGLVRALLRGTGGISRRALGMIGVAAFATFATDVRLGYAQAHVAVVERSTLDFVGWLTAHFVLTCAAIELWRTAANPATAGGTLRSGLAGKLPLVGVAVGYGLMSVAALQEDQPFPWAGLVLGGVGITSLVVLRQLLTQRELTETAATDALTGLANRARLHRELPRALHRAGRSGQRVAVLLIDLNGFKQVNDTLGHQVGDGLLVAVATAMRQAVRGTDLVGRLGGDEFAILVHPVDGEATAAALAQRVTEAVAGPFVVTGRPMSASASIGVALSEPGEVSPDGLLHRADVAMYDQKRRGGGWQT